MGTEICNAKRINANDSVDPFCFSHHHCQVEIFTSNQMPYNLDRSLGGWVKCGEEILHIQVGL